MAKSTKTDHKVIQGHIKNLTQDYIKQFKLVTIFIFHKFK